MVDKIVTVNETAKNLLHPDVATGGDVSNSAALFSSSSTVTVSRITSDKYSGTGCIQAVTSGTVAYENMYSQSYPYVDEATTYTISARVKAPAGAGMLLRIYSAGGGSGDAAFTGTGDWQYITYSFTPSITGYSMSIYIRTNSTPQAITFLVDELQMEKGSSATAWTYPSIKQNFQGEKLSFNNKIASVSDQFTPRNIVDANAANCTNTTGDTTGFYQNNGGTFTSDSTVYYRGNRSLKVVTDTGGQYQGVFIKPRGLVVGQTYTVSAKIKTTVGEAIYCTVTGIGQSPVIGNGDWQSVSYTWVCTATTNGVAFVNSGAAHVATFWVGQIQVELGNTVSEWQPGNMLSYNQQAIETDLTGIGANGVTGLSVSLSRDTTEKYNGSASAKITITDINNPQDDYFTTNFLSIPMVAGKTYLAMMKVKYFKNNHNQETYCYFNVNYASSNHFFSAKTFTGGWDTLIGTITPTVSGTYNLSMTVNGTNTLHVGDAVYVDDVWFMEYPSDSYQVKAQVPLTETQGNLLHPNVASGTDALGNTSYFGWQTGGEILSSDTSQSYQGTRSFKCTTPGIVSYGEGYNTGWFNLKPNTTYTFSGWLLLPVNATVRFNLTNGVTSTIYINVTGTGSWQQVSVQITTVSGKTTYLGQVYTIGGAQAITWWGDAFQLIEGTSTTWQYPSMSVENDNSVQSKNKLTIYDKTLSKNQLYPNQATCGDMEQSVTGPSTKLSRYQGVETVSYDTTVSHSGAGCAKVTTIANFPQQGLRTLNWWDHTVLPGHTYTFSAWVKGTAGDRMNLQIYERNSNGIFIDATTTTAIVMTGEWQRLTGTRTFGANGYNTQLNVCSSENYSVTFWTDDWQFEENATATVWEIPSYDPLYIQTKTTIPEIQKNLLNPNAATGGDVLNSASGIGKWKGTETITRITSDYHSGTGCIQIVTDTANSFEGANITMYAGKPNTSYTFSCWVKGTPGVIANLALVANASQNIYIGTFGTSSNITFNGTWQYATVTGVSQSNAAWVGVVVRTSGTIATTFLIDDLQLEEGTSATAWTYPSVVGLTDNPYPKVKTSVADQSIPVGNNVLPYNTQTCEADPMGLASWVANTGTGTFVRDTTEYYKGSASVKLTSSYVGVQSCTISASAQSLTPGKTYYWKAYTKSTGNNRQFRASAQFWVGGSVVSSATGSFTTLTDDWVYVSLVFTVPAGTTSVTPLISGSLGQGESVWYDEGWLVEYKEDSATMNAKVPVAEIQGNILQPYRADPTQWGVSGGGIISYSNDPDPIATVTNTSGTTKSDIHTYKGITQIIPGQTYTFQTLIKTNGSYNARATIVWYSSGSGGTYPFLSRTYGAITPINSTYSLLTVTGTAPAGANGCDNEIMILNVADGDSFTFKKCQLELGSTATAWIYPSLGASNDTGNMKNKLTVYDIENVKNKIHPNVATCGDELGNTTGMYSHTGIIGSYTVLERHSGTGCFRGDVNTNCTFKGLQPNNTMPSNGFPQYIKPSTVYTCSLWVKSQLTTQTKMYINAEAYNNGIWLSQTQSSKFDTSNEWTRLSVQITTPATANAICVSVRFDSLVVGDILWCDDVQVEEGTTLTDWVYPGASDTTTMSTSKTSPDLAMGSSDVNILNKVFAQTIAEFIEQNLQVSVNTCIPNNENMDLDIQARNVLTVPDKNELIETLITLYNYTKIQDGNTFSDNVKLNVTAVIGELGSILDSIREEIELNIEDIGQHDEQIKHIEIHRIYDKIEEIQDLFNLFAKIELDESVQIEELATIHNWFTITEEVSGIDDIGIIFLIIEYTVRILKNQEYKASIQKLFDTSILLPR